MVNAALCKKSRLAFILVNNSETFMTKLWQNKTGTPVKFAKHFFSIVYVKNHSPSTDLKIQDLACQIWKIQDLANKILKIQDLKISDLACNVDNSNVENAGFGNSRFSCHWAIKKCKISLANFIIKNSKFGNPRFGL